MGVTRLNYLKYTSERNFFVTEVVGEMTHILQIQIDFPLRLEVSGTMQTNHYDLPQCQKSAAHVQHPTNSFSGKKANIT